MEPASTIPWWATGVFSLLGALVGASGAIAVASHTSRVGRIRERYAALRSAYAELVSLVYLYAQAAADFDSVLKRQDAILRQSESPDKARSQKMVEEDVLTCRDRLLKINDESLGPVARATILDHNSQRSREMKAFFDQVRGLLGKAEYLKAVGRTTDVRFLSSDVVASIWTKLTEVGDQLRDEERKECRLLAGIQGRFEGSRASIPRDEPPKVAAPMAPLQ